MGMVTCVDYSHPGPFILWCGSGWDLWILSCACSGFGFDLAPSWWDTKSFLGLLVPLSSLLWFWASGMVLALRLQLFIFLKQRDLGWSFSKADSNTRVWAKNFIWAKDWCWSQSSNNLATRCKEPIHWTRPWCWEKLKAKREEGSRGWDG